MAAVEEVEITTEEGTSLRVGVTDFEAVVLRDQVPEAGLLLTCWTVDLEEVSSARNGRCYSPSSLFGLSRPPHFSKRPRNFLSLPPEIQVSVPVLCSVYQPRTRNLPLADETTESHVPTADKVSQVFNNKLPHLFNNSLLEIEEGIEEANFEDLALVHERIHDSSPTAPAPAMTAGTTIRTEITVSGDRELARVKAAPDPLVAKQGRILDMVSVEQQIRRLLADKGKRDMALPACDKSTGEKISTLGALFGLQCTTKDSELGRFTTLTKTKDSGKKIDKKKVVRTMRGFGYLGYQASNGVSDAGWDGRGNGKGNSEAKSKEKDQSGHLRSKEKDQSGHLKTKEGDLVGRVRARCFHEFNSPGFRLTNGAFLCRLPRRSARRT